MRDQRGSLLLYSIPAPDMQSPKGKMSKKDVEEMTCIAFVLERIRSIARNISEMIAYQTQPPTNHCLIFAKSFIKRLLISGCFYYTTLLRQFFKKTKMFTNLFWKCGFREEKTPNCVCTQTEVVLYYCCVGVIPYPKRQRNCLPLYQCYNL